MAPGARRAQGGAQTALQQRANITRSPSTTETRPRDNGTSLPVVYGGTADNSNLLCCSTRLPGPSMSGRAQRFAADEGAPSDLAGTAKSFAASRGTGEAHRAVLSNFARADAVPAGLGAVPGHMTRSYELGRERSSLVVSRSDGIEAPSMISARGALVMPLSWARRNFHLSRLRQQPREHAGGFSARCATLRHERFRPQSGPADLALSACYTYAVCVVRPQSPCGEK
jgi:hypothetical protein